jgi:hypothetical protein
MEQTVKTISEEAKAGLNCFYQLLPRKPINKLAMAGLLARFICSTPSLPDFSRKSGLQIEQL